ncbi:hypothetical protein HT031_001711 [Scenedesmus sp. PABB004]|nr:hypothetical protein HT031_001711 [Scenedesmus sp. PABB004]
MQIEKLQEQINKASDRMKEIKAMLDNRAAGGKGTSPEQQAARDRIAKLRAEFDAVLEQKRRLQVQSDDKKTERDKLFAEQRAIKDGIRGPTNLATIETQLQELEFKLTHESLTAAQEKSMRERKDRIEKDRPALARLAALSAKIDEAKAGSEAVRAQITALNSKLDALKAAREEEQGKLAAQRAAEAETRSDVPAMIVEKKELWEVIQALRDKQREIRTAFNAKWDEFKKQDKAWKGWFAQERKKRNESRKQEWEERQAARKARDAEHRPAKFEKEVYTCEQVLSYLRQFVVEAKKGPEEVRELEAPAPGMKLMSKARGESEADALYSGMGGKKGRGARKAQERAAKAPDAGKALPRVLPLETLKTFMALGLEAPKSNDDVPAAIEAVEAKKKEYEEKRDKAALEPPSEEEEAEPEAKEGEEAKEAKDGEEAEEAKDEEEKEAEEEEEKEEPAAAKAEANGDAPKAEANGGAATANGGAAAKEEPAADGAEATKDGLGVKLRVTDDGEVNMDVSV